MKIAELKVKSPYERYATQEKEKSQVSDTGRGAVPSEGKVQTIFPEIISGITGAYRTGTLTVTLLSQIIILSMVFSSVELDEIATIKSDT
ncbi:MAG: hypothetical protein JXQ25_04145 [Deltaproteobacteria bacterium]|nr:hypothetical protein [Deltaproteobacteria bacterium]